MDGEEIGKRVRERRRTLGWSARELCSRAGVSRSYVTSLEAGKLRRPSLDYLSRLAEAMGMPVGDLIDTGQRNEAEQFMHEWQALPPDARELARDFVRMLSARQTKPPLERRRVRYASVSAQDAETEPSTG